MMMMMMMHCLLLLPSLIYTIVSHRLEHNFHTAEEQPLLYQADINQQATSILVHWQIAVQSESMLVRKTVPVGCFTHHIHAQVPRAVLSIFIGRGDDVCRDYIQQERYNFDMILY
jgi:hypothetical protein